MHKTQSIPRCTNRQSLTLFLKRVTARLANSVKLPTSARKNLPQRRKVDSRTKCRHRFGGAGTRQPGGAHNGKSSAGKASVALLCGATPAAGEGFEGYFCEDKFPLSYACASTIYGLTHETGRDLGGANGGAGPTRNPRSTYLSR
jgi:hypothetical protein